MRMRLLERLRAIAPNLLVSWYAWRHPAMPLYGKVLLPGLMLYVISPIDLISDFFPVIGWLDDIALLTFALPALLNFLPGTVTNQARHQASLLRARFSLRRR